MFFNNATALKIRGINNASSLKGKVNAPKNTGLVAGSPKDKNMFKAFSKQF
jgi:hypothetical protein